jgi:hypothetical protein
LATPIAPSADLFKTAWDVQDKHGFSWWDSTIVAAAILAKCKNAERQTFVDAVNAGIGKAGEDATTTGIMK